MFQSPGSIVFQIGPVPVHWYGLIIGAGILLAYFYAFSELKRRKFPTKHVDDMAVWLILGGVAGARLYYVLFNLSYFAFSPAEIFQIWKGGLAIHGALLGGAAAFFIYIYRHKLAWKVYADVIMPGVLLAQAVGRWGNFFNSEAFGRPTSLPWKLFIPAENRPPEFKEFSYFHPTFLYESLWNLAGFAVLAILARRFYSSQENTAAPRRAGGWIFCAYLTWYSAGRFFIEGLRTDSLYLGPLRAAQVVSALLFVSGIIGLIFLWKKHKIKTG